MLPGLEATVPSVALDEAPGALARLGAVLGAVSIMTAVASRVGDGTGLGIATGLGTATGPAAELCAEVDALPPEPIEGSDTIFVVAPEPLKTTDAELWSAAA